MNFSGKSIGLICLLGLLGCQPQGGSTSAPVIELPMQLSDSYQTAFAETPDLTARRFLKAFDDFAATGPVTRERLMEHARMWAALERGKFLGHILAMDLNGDMKITRSEVHAVLALPSWSNRPILIENIFESDSNQDGTISLKEARRHSHILYSNSASSDMRPIESYLMIFDLNKDDILTTGEIEVYLYRRLTSPDSSRQGLRGQVGGSSPR